jgi:hypothetical protein
MSRYTDQERDEILAQSRRLLDEREREDHPPNLPSDDPPAIELSTETLNQRHRREIEAQDRLFAAERRRDRRQHRPDTRQLTVADVETLIAAALCVERQAVIPIVAECINELIDAERERHKSELLERTRGLELAVAKLESTLAQLQLTLATERSGVVDLPNPLRH